MLAPAGELALDQATLIHSLHSRSEQEHAHLLIVAAADDTRRWAW
ncbi:MAG: hypothetical protein U0836_21285 [Pirellulales bacterium]